MKKNKKIKSRIIVVSDNHVCIPKGTVFETSDGRYLKEVKMNWFQKLYKFKTFKFINRSNYNE